MWQVRMKIRCPIIDWETQIWLKGSEPLGRIWFQLALTIPAIFGFDLEVATK